MMPFTLALTYAEVEYDKVWDVEYWKVNFRITIGSIFTMRFYRAVWKILGHLSKCAMYIAQVKQMEAMAKELGFEKVSEQRKPLQEP